MYLCKYWSIFFQILICSSWDDFLWMQLLLKFILTKASWRIFAIKGGMSIFYILRVFSMGHDFFSKLDSTFPSFASNIYVVLASFMLNSEYVVDETKSYLKCTLYFVSIFCWISPPILVRNKYYKSSLFIFLISTHFLLARYLWNYSIKCFGIWHTYV